MKALPAWLGSRALVVALALMLTACELPGGIHSGGKGQRYPAANEVPVAVNFQTTLQLKLQAAEHWNRVAADSAAALSKSLRRGTTLFVRRTCETSGCVPRPCDTTFNRVFYNEFVTALVNAGHTVAREPVPNATVVEVDTQAIIFANDRPQYRYAGRAVALGPGIWALRDAASLVESDGNIVLRTDGGDANWFRTEFAAGRTPRNELVVTATAISPQNTYIARNTSVYYTADADSAHYFCSGEHASEIAKMAVPRSRVWTIPVTGDCSAPRCVEPGRRP